MAALTNNAEGGTSGVLPATTDTGSGDQWSVVTRTDASAVLEYTNVAVAHGGLAYRFASRGVASAEILEWSATAVTSMFGRFYLMADATMTTGPRLARFKASAAGNLGCYIVLNSTGAISLRNNSEVSVYTFTNLLTLGTWYRLEFNFVPNVVSATSGTIQGVLYSLDSTSAIEDSGVVTVTTGSMTTCGTVSFGPSNAGLLNTPSATGFIYLDDLVAFSATWPGPVVATTAADQPHPFLIPIMSNTRI